MDHHSRRQFLQGMSVASLCVLSGCGLVPPLLQQAVKVRLIGLLATTSLDPSPEGKALRDGLRELGWVQGQNLAIEYRYGGATPAAAKG